MPNPSRLVRFVAMVVCLMFLIPAPFGFFNPTKVSAGTARITSFDGDLTTKTLDFSNSQVNDTLAIRIPKQSRVTAATMEVKPLNVSQPGHIILDTTQDFMNANPSGLNVNKTQGIAYINEKTNLSDQFNDGNLDVANWSWMNPPSAVNENLGTGMLEITSQAHTNWTSGTQTGSYLYKDVTGNFMAITKISCNPTKNQESCGVMVYSDTNNWFQEVFKWRKYGNNGGNMIDFKIRNGGGNSNDDNAGFSANPLWIKITRYKDQWTVWYSNNPVVYTRHGVPFNWSLPSSVRVGPIVYDGLEASLNFRADFDYINITRYLDYGNMTVGPIITKFPVTHVRMLSDLEQLETWETFDVSVRANDSDPWQSLIGDVDTPLNNPGTKFMEHVSIGGKGWTTPTLRSVKLDYYPDSWPSKVSVDVGNDGTKEWMFNGTFLSKANISTPNLYKALEGQRSSLTQDAQGYVHIPIHVTSATAGQLVFQTLRITLLSGHPPAAPVLGLPMNNTWIGTPTPTFNFSATDQDSDTLKYELQISQDNFTTLIYDFDQNKDPTGWSMDLYDAGKDARFSMTMGGSVEQGKVYQWRARAFGGGWVGNFSVIRTFRVDTTPPTVVIKDSGPQTAYSREATATMTITDAESGVVAAECGLGSIVGMTDLVAKAPVNITTGKVHFTNLSLENNKTYYFTGRALNKAGVWSQNISSTGFRINIDLDPAPKVDFTNPANGTMLDGTVTVMGTASSTNLAAALTVYVEFDDGAWNKALGSKLWSFDWDTKKVADGSHFIYAKAFDGIRDGPTVSRRVNVGNGRMTFSSWTPLNDTTMTEMQNITLTVTLRDPSNIFKTYSWSIDGISVPNVNTNSFTFQTGYDDAGKRVIEVNAMGVSMSIQHKWNITVNNKNRSPKALISYPTDKMQIENGKTLMFDGSQSNDPDKGDTLTYLWEFSDKTTATTEKVNKKFGSPGTYTAKLTVKDSYNVTSTTQVTVTVNAKKVDIGQQLITFPLVLIWFVLVIVIVVVVVTFLVRKLKHQKDFEKKIEQKIDDSTIDDLLYYNPQQGAPQQPMAPGQGQYQPPQQQQPPQNPPQV